MKYFYTSIQFDIMEVYQLFQLSNHLFQFNLSHFRVLLNEFLGPIKILFTNYCLSKNSLLIQGP